MASFDMAYDSGADGVELDVQLSADGSVVVIHDDTVDRTTDGRGKVGEITLASLKELDAGSWFGHAFAGERIPTLAEVCAWAPDDLLLNIEIKSRSALDTGIEKKLIAQIKRSGLQRRVIISSFNPLALYRVRRAAPELSTGLLYSQELPIFLRRAWLRPLANPSALHPHYTLVDEPYVRWLRATNLRLNVWTVDGAEMMRHMITRGADAIITNQPDVLAKLQRQRRTGGKDDDR
jgi:glycerophosphoryl diester phosphodiesterase